MDSDKLEKLGRQENTFANKQMPASTHTHRQTYYDCILCRSAREGTDICVIALPSHSPPHLPLKYFVFLIQPIS